MFTGMTVSFLREFGTGLWVAAPVLLSLAIIIVLLGQFVGRHEGWSRFDAFYWSFVTATTVGYGDLRPTKRRSRMVALVIAVLGLVLTGILIAIAVRAATMGMQAHASRV
jgi:voltage-gated potassium channel